MTISVVNAINGSYRTTKTADAFCENLNKSLGYRVRYLPARLAIARSLSKMNTPEPIDEDDELARPIRGLQLFGEGDNPNAWIALIVQSAGRSDISQKDFQTLVAAHWHRGANLLAHDWKEAHEDLSKFVVRLAELANLPEGNPLIQGKNTEVGTHGEGREAALTGEIRLPVGPLAEDTETRKPVVFPLNISGGSPHMAIMGGTNSGKTYTAITMLRKLATYGDIPFLAFDFKGDLSEKLAGDIGAEVISPPRQPVPLDVLTVNRDDDTGIVEAAGRIRGSISRIKITRFGGIQADALRQAIQHVLHARAEDHPPELEDVARALSAVYKRENRKSDELVATLNELTQLELFKPKMTPELFFSRSWIVRLPQDGTPEARRLIVNMTLDSLDRWLNALPDAPIIEGRQSVRHVCLLDEAHVILRTRLPALYNLIRMSRSKGGVFILISQSPDDFEGQEEGFLDNMGLTLAFNTQAKPGPTKRIFGPGYSLVDMGIGEALCRIRAEAVTKHILAWKPSD